eukprot:15469956-Alexandrium_andersonii.AAC.1
MSLKTATNESWDKGREQLQPLPPKDQELETLLERAVRENNFDVRSKLGQRFQKARRPGSPDFDKFEAR